MLACPILPEKRIAIMTARIVLQLPGTPPSPTSHSVSLLPRSYEAVQKLSSLDLAFLKEQHKTTKGEFHKLPLDVQIALYQKNSTFVPNPNMYNITSLDKENIEAVQQIHTFYLKIKQARQAKNTRKIYSLCDFVCLKSDVKKVLNEVFKTVLGAPLKETLPVPNNIPVPKGPGNVSMWMHRHLYFINNPNAWKALSSDQQTTINQIFKVHNMREIPLPASS